MKKIKIRKVEKKIIEKKTKKGGKVKKKNGEESL